MPQKPRQKSNVLSYVKRDIFKKVRWVMAARYKYSPWDIHVVDVFRFAFNYVIEKEELNDENFDTETLKRIKM